MSLQYRLYSRLDSNLLSRLALSYPIVLCRVVSRQMQFLGVHQPDEARKSRSRSRRSSFEPAPVVPQAIIVAQTGSPGVGLDLGRTKTALPLPGATKGYVQCDCDVLLVMTRRRAVLLYFAVGEDVR